jgi:phosphoenolpyruvate carboxykinase (ATP)
MLAERMQATKASCWLVNTGWTGGKYGTGKRCPLKYTRRIVDAIHSGELLEAEYENFDVFNLSIPTSIEGIPREILNPSLAWKDKNAFTREVRKLGAMFNKAFLSYRAEVSDGVRMAGPQL